MALVASVDYPSKRIFLGIDSVGVDVLPVDIYKEVRALRRTVTDHRRFFPIISAPGNEPAGPGAAVPTFTNLVAGARVVPFDSNHILSITGFLIGIDDNLAGTDLFDRSSLTPGVEVDIDYQPDQDLVRVITTGSGVLPSDIVDFKNAIYDEQIENGITYRQVQAIKLAALAGLSDGMDGTLGHFRKQADNGDRITVNFDQFGNRTSITFDLTDV